LADPPILPRCDAQVKFSALRCSHVHTLTATQPKQGAAEAVWQGERIVAVIDRGFQNGLELRTLSTPPTEVGQRLGEGWSRARSPRTLERSRSRTGDAWPTRTAFRAAAGSRSRAVERLGKLPCGYLTSAV
jgi:hypothetical protein